MAILNPDHLLDQSRRLIATGRRPRQVDLRRAISGAYYAVFHAVVTAAADEIVGQIHRGSPEHGLVARAVDHRAITVLCIEIGKSNPGRRFAAALQRAALGAEMQEFAAAFPELQDKRHSADYDALENYVTSDAATATAAAEAAINAFRAAPPKERKAFAYLLLFPPRG